MFTDVGNKRVLVSVYFRLLSRDPWWWIRAGTNVLVHLWNEKQAQRGPHHTQTGFQQKQVTLDGSTTHIVAITIRFHILARIHCIPKLGVFQANWWCSFWQNVYQPMLYFRTAMSAPKRVWDYFERISLVSSQTPASMNVCTKCEVISSNSKSNFCLD